VAICLECSADLHMAQMMPLPFTVSCFSKIQIGFTVLAPAHPGGPGQRAVERVCVCVSARLTADQAGLQKIADKFKKYDFSALLLIGGFEVNTLLLGNRNLSHLLFSVCCVSRA